MNERERVASGRSSMKEGVVIVGGSSKMNERMNK